MTDAGGHDQVLSSIAYYIGKGLVHNSLVSY